MGFIPKRLIKENLDSVDVLVNDLQKPIEQAIKEPYETILVFLDEINTSKEVGSFKEVVCDHSLKGTQLPDNLVIVAALNPYRQRAPTKTKEELWEQEDDDASNPKNYVDDLEWNSLSQYVQIQ